MKRLISSEKNSVAINSNELINISDIYVYKHLHFISCSEHLRSEPKFPLTITLTQRGCSHWSIFLQSTLIGRRSGNTSDKILLRKAKRGKKRGFIFIVIIRNWIPPVWMPVTSALDKAVADVANICRPEYVCRRENIWTAWDVPSVFITGRLFRFVEEKNRDLDPLSEDGITEISDRL